MTSPRAIPPHGVESHAVAPAGHTWQPRHSICDIYAARVHALCPGPCARACAGLAHPTVAPTLDMPSRGPLPPPCTACPLAHPHSVPGSVAPSRSANSHGAVRTHAHDGVEALGTSARRFPPPPPPPNPGQLRPPAQTMTAIAERAAGASSLWARAARMRSAAFSASI